MTRVLTMIATLTLAVAVLFRSPSDYRTAVCVVVSLATVTLAVRSLFAGKLLWALLFLVALGIFTPFQLSPFSPFLVSVLDMATLALFAAALLMLTPRVMIASGKS